MAWEEGYRNITAALEKLKPLHDFCLVEHVPETETVLKSGLHMTGDYRWRADRPRGIRRGRVLAVGLGDRIIFAKCVQCGAEAQRVAGRAWRCFECGGDLESTGEVGRCEMGVKPGDIILYPRIPSNDVIINGKEYTICHEEQHVLAVIQEEGCAA